MPSGASRIAGIGAAEHNVGVEPEPRRGRRGLAHVIALHAAAGHEHVGALRERFGAEPYEFARLVAAEREAGQVVALHAHSQAERVGEPGRVVDRCRRVDHRTGRRRSHTYSTSAVAIPTTAAPAASVGPRGGTGTRSRRRTGRWK